MLAPLIAKMLIASLLFLLAGWLSDIVHAHTEKRPNYLDLEGTIGWDEMSRPRKSLPRHDPDATRRARPVRRHRPLGRLPWHRVSFR
jgi:hypothetical protein